MDIRDPQGIAPYDAEHFARMFGSAAGERRPELYHLMALSPAGGFDLMIPWESMLAAAPKVLRHEDAFGWLGMRRDPSAVHCALLDCVLRECCSLSGVGFPPGSRPSTEASWAGHGASGTLTAYAIFDPLGKNGGALAALEAVGSKVQRIAPGAQAIAIPERIAHALSMALLSGPGETRAQIIASAAEAIAITRESAHGLPGARPTRI